MSHLCKDIAHLLSPIIDKRMGVIFLFCIESAVAVLDKKQGVLIILTDD